MTKEDAMEHTEPVPYPVWPKIGFSDFLEQSEADWHRCPECEKPMRQDNDYRLPCEACK